jgi:hypothetical protein
MRKILADRSYCDEQVSNVKNEPGYDMEITLRSNSSKEFKPLPKR